MFICGGPLTSQVATFVPIKFGSSSFNGDRVIQQSVRKGLERKKERKN